MSIKKYYAAIDLGSRNCRLLVTQYADGITMPLELQSRIVDLGEGIQRTNRLSKKAIERSINVLKQYKSRLQDYHNVIYRCVTTEACRRADNRNSFLERVEREVGLSLEVIDFHQEALYALKGCGPIIDPNANYILIFDIGGASTELIWAENLRGVTKIIDCISIPSGVITISESFMSDLLKHYQETSHLVFDAARIFRNKNKIQEIISEHKVQLIGTSGTTTTFAALHLDLRFYSSQKVDNITLTYEDVQKVIKKIQLMSSHERLIHPCIGSNREDLILEGAAIFEGLYRAWPELNVHVTDRGVRDGIVAELIKVHETN